MTSTIRAKYKVVPFEITLDMSVGECHTLVQQNTIKVIVISPVNIIATMYQGGSVQFTNLVEGTPVARGTTLSGYLINL